MQKYPTLVGKVHPSYKSVIEGQLVCIRNAKKDDQDKRRRNTHNFYTKKKSCLVTLTIFIVNQ